MFLRVENPKNRDKWYFKTYVYKCDRCGKEFTHAKKDRRIQYCGECHSFLDKAKAKERRTAQLLGVDELKQKVGTLEYINGCLILENNRLWGLLKEEREIDKYKYSKEWYQDMLEDARDE